MKYPVFIEPGNDDGMLLDSKAVKGTYVVVNTIDELNLLKVNHSGSIVNGSLCYVVNESKTYRYNGTQWTQSKDESDISDLAAQILLNKQNIDEINDCINKNVVDSLSVTADKDNVNINTRTINLLNKETATDIDALPLASIDNAGIMTASDYNTLYDLITRVENLEGTTNRLLYATTDTLKEIQVDDKTYSPAFYINGEIYQISGAKVEHILQLNLRDFIATLKENINLTDKEYTLNFFSNGVNYKKITITSTTIKYDDDVVFNGQWVLSQYRTLRFIDGEDIANPSLVEYLKENTELITQEFNISGSQVTINNITYTFSNFNIGGNITRTVNANNINSFITTIYDKKGQQLYFEPFRGISVVIDGTYHIWHYYPNEEGSGVIGWRDDGLDTVQQFTNTTAGIIKGSTNDGQVYAESNGTGSVNGWNDLKNRVSNVEKNKADDVLATAEKKGLLSANDYTKIQGIENNAQVNILEGIQADGILIEPENKIINIKQGNNILFQQEEDSLTINANIPDPVTIDTELSETSINPVQNQVITKALKTKADLDVVQLKITENNKLNSDLVNDTNQNHKFVTETEKNQITTNKNNIENLKKTKQDNLSAGRNMTIENNVVNTTASRVYGNITNEPTKDLTNIQIEDTVYKIPVYGLTIYTPIYDITTNLINVTADTSNPTTIISGGTISLTFIANAGYSLPDTINVTGATSQWNQSSGILKLIEPVDDIVITIVGNGTTSTLKAGTYKFIQNPTLPTEEIKFPLSLYLKGYTLTANNTYSDLTDIQGSVSDIQPGGISIQIGTMNLYKPGMVTDHDWVTYYYDFTTGQMAYFTADDDTKLRTIICTQDITVEDDFYNWAILQGNLIYQETETWVLNETLSSDSAIVVFVNFESNGEKFSGISILRQGTSVEYDGSQVYNFDLSDGWCDDAYRTITFDSPVTDETLLAWLEANGTKQ